MKRVEQEEDHATRRTARILGGIVWLLGAGLVLADLATLAWVLAALIAIMVALDASVSFCALCFVVARFDRLRVRPT